MTDAELDQWSDWSKRDDWHTRFVASDIRQMIGEIERLRNALYPVAQIPLLEDGPSGAHVPRLYDKDIVLRARAALSYRSNAAIPRPSLSRFYPTAID